jgi:hypothetical protein
MMNAERCPECGQAVDAGTQLVSMTAERDSLFEEVQEWEQLNDMLREREKPWIERWRAETGHHWSLPDYGELIAWIIDKSDARIAELEAALARRVE